MNLNKVLVILDLKGLVINSFSSVNTAHSSEIQTNDIENQILGGLETFIGKFLDPALKLASTPMAVIGVLDGGKSYRRSIDSGYSNRPKGATPESVVRARDECLGRAKKVMVSIGCPLVCLKGEEADDVIAFLAARSVFNMTAIYTVDYDLVALNSDKVKVFIGGQIREDMRGVPSNLTTLYKSMVGDTSDTYIGIRNFGEKSWASMVEEFGYDGMEQLDSLVANNNKAGAIAKYSTIQEIYKQIPKEPKAQILAKCLEAQKIISGK